MDHKTAVVLYSVASARLLLPFTIPRYPLPGVLACLVLDSADQSIFAAFGLRLVGYQGYDKALDIYYLSVAYLSTFRNWRNLAALGIGRVLYYLRLAGVLAFELSNLRLLLAIFPNAFEVYFIFNEIVRRRGRHLLLTRGLLVALAAGLWFVVKLPHEWWVHIARLDATDFIKTKILGADLETPLWRAVFQAPLVTGALTVVAALLALVVWRGRQRLKGLGRWGSRLARTRGRLPAESGPQPSDLPRSFRIRRLRIVALLEKILLVTAICVIFQQTLPGLEANGIQTAVFVAVAIIGADFLLRWVVRHLGARTNLRAELLQGALVNFGFVLLFQLFLPVLPPRYNLGPALLFAALITLFVTLYDLYRPVHGVRGVAPGLAATRI